MCLNERYRAESGRNDTSPKRLFSPSSSENTDLKPRTQAIIRGLLLVMRHHGAQGKVLSQLHDQVHHYLDDLKTEENWMKYAKYLLNYPMASYLRNELPKNPGSCFKPTGVLKRWMKARLFIYCSKNTHLWFSWLQCKRSALPVSDSMLEKSYQDHLVTLTKPDGGDGAYIDEILNDRIFRSVITEVKKGFMEEYLKTDPLTFKPKSSACLTHTRSKGGQVQALRDLVDLDWCPTDELTMMKEYRVRAGDSDSFHVFETRGISGQDSWEELRLPNYESRPGGLSARIQGVLEPMKVRPISKGPPREYYLMKGLQVALHSTMRKMACFRLIGRPFCPTDVIDTTILAKPDWEHFSIDYSGATDNLSWKYSGKIMELLLSDLSLGERNLAMDVLGPHRLEYPIYHEVFGHKGRQDFEERGTMQGGQLMGSILSFPILCMANLGVYLYTTRYIHRGWSRDQRLSSVLINGDDMLYSAPSYLWNQHVEIAGAVGLEMSVGKSYHHPKYANVNSCSVNLNIRERTTPKKIGFLNTGLFFGQSKVLGDDRGEKLWDFESPSDRFAFWKKGLQSNNAGFRPTTKVATLNTLLAGCLPGRQDDILKQFLAYHKQDIRNETAVVLHEIGFDDYGRKLTRKRVASRNLFLPESQGGMGVDSPVGWRFRVTRDDKMIAYTLGIFETVRTCRPIRGYDYEDLDLQQVRPWSTSSDSGTVPKIKVYKDLVKKDVESILLNVVPVSPLPNCVIV